MSPGTCVRCSRVRDATSSCDPTSAHIYCLLTPLVVVAPAVSESASRLDCVTAKKTMHKWLGLPEPLTKKKEIYNRSQKKRGH